jgi:hypothetical protein
MRRLRGLFVITRALLPFILVIGVLAATLITSRLVIDATQRYGESLGSQLEAVGTAVAEANEGLDSIAGFVTSTIGAADTLLDNVDDLRSEIEIPLPAVVIPDFEVLDRIIDLPDLVLGDGHLTIPVPGVEPLQGMASDLVAAGRRVADPVVKVAALADVPPQLEQAGRDTVEYAGDVRSVITGWFAAVAIILVLGAVVWLIAAARPVTTELRRGWTLLRGQGATAGRTKDLAERVAALERQLAAMAPLSQPRS